MKVGILKCLDAKGLAHLWERMIEYVRSNSPVTSVNGQTGDVVVEGSSGGPATWDNITNKPFKKANFCAIEGATSPLYQETINALVELKNSGINSGDIILLDYDSGNTTSAVMALVYNVDPLRLSYYINDKFVRIVEFPVGTFTSTAKTVYLKSSEGIGKSDLSSEVTNILNTSILSESQDVTQIIPISQSDYGTLVTEEAVNETALYLITS